MISFHHIGVACQDIDKTASEYQSLGYEASDTIIDPLQNIKVCFLYHPTMPCVELLAPVDEKSPVVSLLKKSGTTPYHTCYTVLDIKEAIADLKNKGYIVVSPPKTACAMNNGKVAFLYKKDMGLIEIFEESKK